MRNIPRGEVFWKFIFFSTSLQQSIFARADVLEVMKTCFYFKIAKENERESRKKIWKSNCTPEYSHFATSQRKIFYSNLWIFAAANAFRFQWIVFMFSSAVKILERNPREREKNDDAKDEVNEQQPERNASNRNITFIRIRSNKEEFSRLYTRFYTIRCQHFLAFWKSPRKHIKICNQLALDARRFRAFNCKI